MSLRAKIFALVLLATTIPYITVGILTYTDVRASLERDARDDVNVLASIQKQRTVALMESHRETLALVQSRGRLVDLFAAYRATQSAAVRAEILAVLQSVHGADPSIASLSLVSEDGAVLISTDTTRLGSDVGNEAVVHEALSGTSATDVVKRDGVVYIELAGPLVSSGRTIGAVVISMQSDELFALFRDYTGLGESGSWGVAKREPDGSALVIVPSRFETNPDAALTTRIENSPANENIPIMHALRGEEKVFTDLTTYTGKHVIVATRYIPDLGWGLGVTMQRSEVFKAANELLGQMLVFLFLLVLLVGFFASIITQALFRPLKVFARAAERVSAGDLSVQVPIESHDELGLLARVFNEMVQRLRANTRDLERQVAEKTRELQESRQELRDYIDQMSTFNAKLDTEGNFLLINRPAQQVSGLSPEALMRTNFLQGPWFSYDTAVLERVQSAFKQALQGEKVVYDEAILLAGGEHRWLNLSFSPVKNEAGAIAYVIAEGRDIHELKQVSVALAEAKAKDEAILASIVDGVVIVDMSGVPVYANESAKRLMGVDLSDPAIAREGVQRFRFFDENGHEELAAHDRPIARLLRGERVEDEVYFVTSPEHPAGRTITLTACVVHNQEGPFGIMIAFRDVTKEHEVEKAKSEFVSIASHQLRTPLTTIRWYAEMLLAGLSDGKPRSYAAEVLSATRRLIELVNALLSASRLDTGTTSFTFAQVDAREVLAHVLKAAEEKMQHKRLQLRLHESAEPCRVRTDESHLAIVLQNLLVNAIKYTPEGGSIDMTLACDDQKGCTFTIEDSGIGIPRADQEKIFSRFFRANNAHDVDPNGTGLGLYIAHAIVKKLGGSLSFVSEEGKGARFSVWIPDAPAT